MVTLQKQDEGGDSVGVVIVSNKVLLICLAGR